jgi:hypothetical protein
VACPYNSRLPWLSSPVPVSSPVLQIVDEATANRDVFIKLGKPSAATHVLTVQPGEVVEIVIQNDRAGLFGGEYASNSTLTSARNGREQHSFHLHGYHFWQVCSVTGGAWCRKQPVEGESETSLWQQQRPAQQHAAASWLA